MCVAADLGLQMKLYLPRPGFMNRNQKLTLYRGKLDTIDRCAGTIPDRPFYADLIHSAGQADHDLAALPPPRHPRLQSNAVPAARNPEDPLDARSIHTRS